MISDAFRVGARSLFSVPEQLIGLLVAGRGGAAFRHLCEKYECDMI